MRTQVVDTFEQALGRLGASQERLKKAQAAYQCAVSQVEIALRNVTKHKSSVFAADYRAALNEKTRAAAALRIAERVEKRNQQYLQQTYWQKPASPVERLMQQRKDAPQSTVITAVASHDTIDY